MNNCLANSNKLDNISKATNDPVAYPKPNGPKSYSTAYIKEYFSDSIVQASFKLYIDYLFVDDNPDLLSLRFNFHCCSSSSHLAKCKENWEILRNHLKNDFFLIN